MVRPEAVSSCRDASIDIASDIMMNFLPCVCIAYGPFLVCFLCDRGIVFGVLC